MVTITTYDSYLRTHGDNGCVVQMITRKHKAQLNDDIYELTISIHGM